MRSSSGLHGVSGATAGLCLLVACALPGRVVAQTASPGATTGSVAAMADALLAFREGEAILRQPPATRDAAQACERFDVAAREALPQAWFRVGQCYANGWGRTADAATAARWYQQAAERGVPGAQMAMGFALQRGEGVARDDAEAARWLDRAARAGESTAALALARAFETGQGVAPDALRAAQWLQHAADARNPAAQLLLAQWYLQGRLVNGSALHAYAWSSLATAGAARLRDPALADQIGQRATAVRRQAAAGLGAEELLEGQRIAREWAPGRLPLALPAHNGGGASPTAPAVSPPGSGALATRPPIPPPSATAGTWPAPAPLPIPDPKPATPARTTSGSGFYVSRDGHLVTNDHVIRDCRELRLPGGQTLRVVARDSRADLALLMAAPVSHVAKLRAQAQAEQGEEVLTYGFPLHGVLSSSGQLGAGMVTALAGLRDNPLQIQIDVAVQPGNSGGPLLDSRGEVIGVVVSKLNALRVAQVTGDIPQNVNFAVALAPLKNLLTANAVPIQIGPPGPDLSRQQVAEQARRFTTAVLCAR